MLTAESCLHRGPSSTVKEPKNKCKQSCADFMAPYKSFLAYGSIRFEEPKWEKSVLSLLRDSGLNLSLHAASTTNALWKGVPDKHQNPPLVMSSGKALCSHWTMAEASWGSPAAQGFGQQTAAGAKWWKLGLGAAGDPTLPSSTLSSPGFVSYFYRQGEFRRPPASQAAQHSSIRKVTSIRWHLYQVWAKIT